MVSSGLYKDIRFSFASAIKDKIALLDDTCYQIGFDDEQNARITYQLLNSCAIQNFIKSLYFENVKRPYY